MPTTTDETSGATVHPPRNTAKLYNDIAALYDRFTRSLDASEAPVNRWLVEHLGSGRRALDLACGSGRCTVLLADRYEEVVGVDAAPAMIEIAGRERSRPNIRYQNRDVLALTPEHDGRFDLVLAFGCVQLVGPPDLVLGHFRRLVAKGGTLLIVEPVRPSTRGIRDWQVDFAFRMARVGWEATGDLDDVAAALRFLLSPTWLETSEISVPLTCEDFLREYSTALPGAIIEEGYDIFATGGFVVSWRAEDEW